MRRVLNALVFTGVSGLLISALFGASGCIDAPDPPVLPETDGSTLFPPSATDKPQGDGSAQNGTKAKPPLEVLTEVVYVLMKAYDGGQWMCTGALVSNDTVITAAHCLDDDTFESFEIVAPLAKNAPRSKAGNARMFSREYDDITNPDIGFLKLDDPIQLPSYATLTDVTSRVQNGEKLTASIVVRKEQELEAPFKAVEGLAVTSTTARGYDHGVATKYFSHGGDSGAGLFLVENGQVTHKLIAVVRQPEPDENLDHFTRIDKEFLDWFKENGGE